MSEIKLGLVSTIIPVFNREEMAVRAIDSVLAQTYRPIEIIVVDDGSTDSTLLVLKSKAEVHPEIIVVTQVKNSGPGVAREAGRQLAKGEYIQYLDSDDVLLPDKFDLQVKALALEPSSDVCYGKTEWLQNGESRIHKAWKKTDELMPAMFPEFLRSRWWGTSTPLYRRCVLDEVGAWLSTVNEEDWEYDCRVAAKGGKLAYVDEFVSLQYGHDQHLSSNGNLDPIKLKHRCIARQSIYQSALKSNVISMEDWSFFSKAVFLLARECAAVGLSKQTIEMLELSVRANGRTRLKHRLFKWAVYLVGCKAAVKMAVLVQ